MGFDYLSGALDEIDVDLFAGGGGASTGMERATGRPVTIAVNHSRAAVAMHAINHPHTLHACEDITKVCPRTIVAGRRVRRLWASPDCTHHSKAKGGQPRSKERRALAEAVIRWAAETKPAEIYLENVEEFQDWGPLDENGKPIKSRKGEDFRAWLAKLVDLGYEVEFRRLVAADYATPTTRRRFCLRAVLRGGWISWPEATHGSGHAHPWRTAAEIIDWSLPCPSIFGRKRPLAEATLRRIAAGLRRYVIESPAPFIVPVTHPRDVRVHGIGDPLRTVTAANRGELALVTPYVASHYGASVGRAADDPLPTVTAGGGGHHAVVAPTFIRTDMQSDNRLRGVGGPAEPLRTITTGGGHALVAPTMVQTGYGERAGQAPRILDLHKPLTTVVGDQKHGLVSAFLAKHYGGPNGVQSPGLPMASPTGTVTTQDHHAVVAAHLSKFYGTSTGADPREPLPTVTASGQHLAAVRAFLVAYYGSEKDGQAANGPLRTVPTRDRFGLVMVHGEPYEIADIGMRMLSPRELFRAQGFGDEYVIDLICDGKPLTKTEQIELAGNSVCPPVAEALIACGMREGRVAA